MNSRLKKFFSYYKPYLGLFSADMLCALIVSAAALALPLCANYITNRLLAGNIASSLSRIYALGALMLALVGLSTLCSIFVDYQGHLMGARMESDMRRELFDHYQKLSFRFYDEHKTGQLMTLVTNDLLDLAELYHHGPEDLAIAVLKLTGVLIILDRIGPGLTWVILLLLPVMAAYAFYFNRRMNRALKRSRARIGDINATVEDTLAGIRVVKSFTNEAIERRKFERQNRRFLESRKEGYLNEARFSGGMDAFSQLLLIAVIVLGGAAIAHSAMSLASLLTYILCVGILLEPIQRLVNFARLYQSGTTAFNRFMDLLEVEPESPDLPGAYEAASVRGRITFENVTFKYKEEHQSILKNISLEIPAGETIAIVGPSGAGKTTLCALIPRFYEVTAGRILLDGTDIRAIRLDSLRRNIGVVQQEVYLFAGTVLENILYGEPSASPSEALEAAKRAHAHEFILRLPDGYDTDIGQRGVKLSGGQKQRLSLARVFLKDPPILILDEATSALDNESERAVQESLETLTAQRTTLIIAHRLSTVRRARRIILLTDHGIEEQGTHAELIAASGAYARLYEAELNI